MSKTKATGTSRLGRDSGPKYLGIKVSNGEPVGAGMVIVKQRGTKFYPGDNVKKGGDDTLYALKSGVVRFSEKSKMSFHGSRKRVKVVSVDAKK